MYPEHWLQLVTHPGQMKRPDVVPWVPQAVHVLMTPRAPAVWIAVERLNVFRDSVSVSDVSLSFSARVHIGEVVGLHFRCPLRLDTTPVGTSSAWRRGRVPASTAAPQRPAPPPRGIGGRRSAEGAGGAKTDGVGVGGGRAGNRIDKAARHSCCDLYVARDVRQIPFSVLVPR